ncbi:MAG: type II restriction endonuclease [Bacteroidaceae bacterium]|nr:type II restriction endonuclease [Bacteroidaceae bacterium]
MKAHSKEHFDEFFSQLSQTNANLSYWTDFSKIRKNVSKVAIRLNTLNYLIGQSDMEKAVRELWEENPKVFSVLNILIAIRSNDKKHSFGRDGYIHPIEDFFTTPEGVLEFIHDTGLQQVFINKDIKDLTDYVFGVEVGLDTNARKNRSGKLMERLVGELLNKNSIPYQEQISSAELPGLEILGEDKKVFDFVIKTRDRILLVEVNYYNKGGSKLNEVARSYTNIAAKIAKTDRYEFVWITDGWGWYDAKNKLQEAYYNISSVYNLTTITNFIATIKSEL